MKKATALMLTLALATSALPAAFAQKPGVDMIAHATQQTAPATEAKTQAESPAEAKTTPAAQDRYHVVVSGDTMKDIAAAHQLSLDQLLALNPEVKNVNLIYVGQKILVARAEVKSDKESKPEAPQEPKPQTPPPTKNPISYTQDGTYRGAFVDGGIQQVGLQFTVTDGVISAVRFRTLKYKDVDYLKSEDAKIKAYAGQYKQLIDSLVGKTPQEAGMALREPAKLAQDVTVGNDMLTSATLRAPKVASALADALNKGVYALPKAKTYADGTYRGYFIDGGGVQVAVQFKLADNKFTEISYRTLAYRGADYLANDAKGKVANIASQYKEALQYLIGKTPNQVGVFDYPAAVVSNVGEGDDMVSGATLRLNKAKVAIIDALNKGAYTGTADISFYQKPYENGTYRGFFMDKDEHQIGVQFTIVDHVVEKVSFRRLVYKGTDYLKSEDPKAKALSAQYKELLDSLVGQKIDHTVKFYSPQDLVKDQKVGDDMLTGATIRSSKVIQAINDALLRGRYSK
ncbi:MAG: LysM peptidoglycan-binding domain-containing protein [Bacillota bacterium]|nr:LysM peptidoglycan-binding domain-containing protein [Bacillota bacterium]